MSGRRWLAVGTALIAAGALTAWAMNGPPLATRDLSGLEGDIDRGAYVARLSGCIACHTDTKAGGAVLAGGPEIPTPFGSFYAPNITPDPDVGIGEWSLEDFSRALTAGIDPDGHHYFPSFPFTFYTRLTDQDVVDLWAAVQSVPPAGTSPPKHGLRFPFGFHEGIGPWKRLFFEPGPLEPLPDKSDAWNRGRYLARGPAHCGACHTPRNLLGGRITDQRYAGGVGPDDEKIPPIRPVDLEQAGWTADDLFYALRAGVKPDGDVFGGSMAEVVRDGTQFWSDSDISAIVEYLLDSEVDQ